MPEKYKVAIVDVKSQAPAGSFYSLLPSLATPLLAGELIKEGYKVYQYSESIRDVSIKDFKNIDVICLSSLTNNASRAYDISKKIKSKFPNKKIIMGGWHASFMYEEAFRNGIDYVIIREGEEALKELLMCLRNNISLEQKTFTKQVSNINDIALPDFSSAIGIKENPFINHPLQISRGCYLNCSFCQIKSFYDKKIKIKSPEKVAEELEKAFYDFEKGYFIPTDNKYRIFLVDDNFGSKPIREETKNVLEYLLKKISKKNIRITTQTRVDIADDTDLLYLFKRLGGKRFLLGLESIKDSQLREMRKGTTSEQIKESIRRLKEFGFEINGLFCVGYDSDTLEDVKEIPKIVENFELDCFSIQILTPFPETEVYDKLFNQNRIFDRNWDHYDFEHVIFEPKNMKPNELENIVIEIMNKHPLSMLNYHRKLKKWKKINSLT